MSQPTNQIPVNKIAKDEHQVQIIPLGDEMTYDFKRPHRHEYFEFFIFVRGGGSHFIDFVEYEILENSVHIIFPSQIHLLKRNGARGQIIICKKEFMNSLNKLFYAQLFQNNYTAPCLSFTDEKIKTINQLVAALQEEIKVERLLATELARSYMSIFLSHCLRNFDAAHAAAAGGLPYTQHDIEVFQKFNLLLEKHYLDKQNVSFYASEMAMTPKSLNTCVKKVTGKTCIELVQERTLTEAKRLLLYTDESSKEIAYTLNFKDNSYFTRFFTKMEGQTPLAFKNYWEEKYHS
jgi:AraC-like DNA-binding protein